jgi:hypothetical protein
MKQAHQPADVAGTGRIVQRSSPVANAKPSPAPSDKVASKQTDPRMANRCQCTTSAPRSSIWQR